MRTRIEQALTRGERFRLVPVERLRDLREDLVEVERREALNGFQRWILSDLYELEVPTLGFTVRSVVLVAIPHPAYARLEFAWEGRVHDCLGLVWSELEATERALAGAFAAAGLGLAPVANLPMKRLAVRCGLSAYGRNNITYVEGMGSHVSLAAWFSEAHGDAEWREVAVAPTCERCRVCIEDCPTGAIRPDRFLIDTDRCLSYLNENAEPFPAWLDPAVHHTVYDCLRCQLRCPMNKHSAAVAGPIRFDEAETALLLAGTPLDRLPPDLDRKVRRLGMDPWWPAIPRNLRTLLTRA